MSVQIIEPEIFSLIINKLIDYSFRKQVDINYCSTAGHMTENQVKETVKYWSILNELSYSDKYKEEFDNLHEMIDYSYNGKTPDTYQTLKWLECIRYNIEIETIKSESICNTMQEKEITGWNSNVNIENPMTILDRIIDEIKSQIIGAIPKYENARWNSID